MRRRSASGQTAGTSSSSPGRSGSGTRAARREDLLIAEHACRKYTGRVGRSAAAKRLDVEAIDLAVRAHVRHRHTSCDAHLMAGWDQGYARAAVVEDIERILAMWRAGRPASRSGGLGGHQLTG